MHVYCCEVDCLRLSLFQAIEKTVAARRPNYEAVLRAGDVLVDQSKPQDAATLRESIDDLKSHWAALGDALTARLEKVEDALRHAIQFQASVGPLMAWIDEAQPTVAADQPLYGDTKTVEDLKAKHRVS